MIADLVRFVIGILRRLFQTADRDLPNQVRQAEPAQNFGPFEIPENIFVPYENLNDHVHMPADVQAEVQIPRVTRHIFDNYVQNLGPDAFVYRTDSCDTFANGMIPPRIAFDDVFTIGHQYNNTMDNFYNSNQLRQRFPGRNYQLVESLEQQIDRLQASGLVARGLYVYLKLRDAALNQHIFAYNAKNLSDTVKFYRTYVCIISRFRRRDLNEVAILPDPVTFTAASASLLITLRTPEQLANRKYEVILTAHLEVWFDGNWHQATEALRARIYQSVSHGDLGKILYPLENVEWNE